MNEFLLKSMTREYVQKLGEQVKAENIQLSREFSFAPTPGLDRRVFSHIAARKRRNSFRAAAIIAACIALLIVTPFALNMIGQFAPTPISTAVPSVSTPAEPLAPEQTHFEPTNAGIIPLSFEMPEGYFAGEPELDNGMTVYQITTPLDDDIVLTLTKDGDISEYTNLKRVLIDDEPVFAKSTADYNLIAFERDNIMYVATCKYDANTIFTLGKNILA